MDQGLRRLPLFVVFLLFWKNADGFAYSTNPNAGQWWGQPSDNTFLPLVVQSSVAEAPVTGVLLEEVGSSLPIGKPKLNVLQVVKGGVSSSSESTSHALPPKTPISALSLPVDQSGMGSLVSIQGSPGSTSTSGSGQIVFAQGESGSFPFKTGVSSQSINDQSLPSSVSQGTTYGVITEGTSQFAQGSSSPYVAVSLPQDVTSELITGPSSKQITTVYGTQTGSSAPFTLRELLQGQDSTSQPVVSSTPYVAVSLPQGVPSQSTTVPSSKKPIASFYGSPTGSSALFTLQGLLQGQDSTSQVVSGSSNPYVAVSLPQGVTSQLTPVPSSKQITSVYSTQTGSSVPFTLQRLVQAQDTRQSGSSTPYVAVSLPQGVTSQLTPVPSSKQFTSVYSTKTGSSAPFTLQGSTTYEGLLQAQDVSQISASSTPYVSVSLPQDVSSQSVVPSSKQITAVYGTQTGSSAPLALQGLIQGQDATSQFVSASSSPYVAVSLPQGVTSVSAVPSSKQITSVYSTQTGSSAPFTLQGGTTYGGLIQAQDVSQISAFSTPFVSVLMPQGVSSQSVVPSSKQITTVYGTQGSTTYGGLIKAQDSTSQVLSGSSSPYLAVSMPQVVSQLTTVPSSKKPITSVYGTQTVSSAPFTLQGLLQGQDSTSRVVSGSSSPYVAVTLPQGVSSQSVVPSSKQITTVYGTQGSTTYGGPLQAQDKRSRVSGSSTPYVAVSLPQGVSSQPAVPSSKQISTVYGTQTGSSAPFTLQGLTQGQDATSQFVSVSSSPYVAVSLPQGVTSLSAVPSSKQISTVYGTQTGSSAPFTLQGLIHGQDTTGQLISGSSTPYVAVSSSTTVPSSEQVTSVYATQTGSSPTLNLQGLLQPQDATSPFSIGSSSSVLQTSTADAANPSSSFSTLRRYYSVKG